MDTLESLIGCAKTNSSELHVSIVLVRKSRSLGCASADLLEPPGIWWLARLFLREDVRNIGLGSAVMKLLLADVGMKPGFEKLVVAPGGYDSDPDRLFAFYRRLGFRDEEDGSLAWRNQ